jgi:hypothetical protein
MGMENLKLITETNINQEVAQSRPYFEQVNTSKEFLAAKRFTEKYIDTGIFTELIDSPDNIEALSIYIQKLGNRLIPGVVVDEVISELRAAGVITPIVVEKIKKEKPVEFLETEYVSLEKLKPIEISDNEQNLLEANLFIEAMQKANVFTSDEELEFLYKQSIESDEGSFEDEQYYLDFVEAGLIKGGKEEVDKDRADLARLKKIFTEKALENPKNTEKIERAKKIATITEYGLAEGVTKHHWYGENVTITKASEFDDVRHGVDDLLEIRKEDEESSFMALGIDITYRGLESVEFKQKFFKLLQSIRDGYKTKVKYGRNHNGELLREFAVPKMVLSFNADDVKEIADLVKHSNDPTYAERFKNSSQKFVVIRQIVSSCRIFEAFAEESQNSIFRKYIAVINSFKEISWENPQIQEILTMDHTDDVTKKLEALVVEFKEEEKRRLSSAE